jgi:hypothetical protein
MAAMVPSPEEKERFLENIRGGDDRATAARRVNPEYSGTFFRRLCNERNDKLYDPEFAAAYEQAVKDRGPLDPKRERVRSDQESPRSTTASGFTRWQALTEEQVEKFLEFVQEGVPAAAAARRIDPPSSITQFHRLQENDAGFAQRFRGAKSDGYQAFKDDLRAEAYRQAFAGDYRALRDQMMMHLEEAKKLLTSRHEIGGLDGQAIRVLAEQEFSDLPKELLDQVIRELEAKELGGLRALEPGEGEEAA